MAYIDDINTVEKQWCTWDYIINNATWECGKKKKRSGHSLLPVIPTHLKKTKPIFQSYFNFEMMYNYQFPTLQSFEQFDDLSTHNDITDQWV